MQHEAHCIRYRMGKPKLIAYSSKRLPEAAGNYSITELEMCGIGNKYSKLCTFIKKSRF